MSRKNYRSMSSLWNVNRRSFLKVGGAVGAGLLLGKPPVWADGEEKPSKPATNIKDALAFPRTKDSLPGHFPGRVVQVHEPGAMVDEKPVAEAINAAFRNGIEKLTGKDMKDSFGIFFSKKDIVGIKVNPVGAGLIATRHEVVEAIVEWLADGGIPRGNIVIWDRFDSMLAESGFNEERYPGLRFEGLQTMGESKEDGTPDWLDNEGNHISAANFDDEMVYWADVDAPQDENYLNQHVFNNSNSPFGRLLTHDLTKIINVPVFKNTGNGISVATKNMGYGAICNTGRLHRPLFFDVCTEVLAFPPVRDKMVLNIADGLRAQYDGGPMPNAKATWIYNTLFMATDPFALDRVCHDLMVEKRKEMGIDVNEHPRYSDYLHYGEKLGLGIANREKIELLKV